MFCIVKYAVVVTSPYESASKITLAVKRSKPTPPYHHFLTLYLIPILHILLKIPLLPTHVKHPLENDVFYPIQLNVVTSSLLQSLMLPSIFRDDLH